MTKKLYKVTCRGMRITYGGSATAYGIAYVVADDPGEAYDIVRNSLDNRDLGFRKDRELSTIELMAEQTDYPDCGTILYI